MDIGTALAYLFLQKNKLHEWLLLSHAMQIAPTQKNFAGIKTLHNALWKDALQRFQSTCVVYIVAKRWENNGTIRHHEVDVARGESIAGISGNREA
jgi:hypothetical protein